MIDICRPAGRGGNVTAVRTEKHWWNGDRGRSRRDVYIRTDGERWEVEAQVGGVDGRSKVQQCPSGNAATILANAWLAGRQEWRSVKP
jgi:hypothetical protein